MQQAGNLAGELGVRMESLRFLLRDRDGKFGDAFDAVFEAEELSVIATAPRVPRMNAQCERIIGSIRREILDHVSSWEKVMRVKYLRPTKRATTSRRDSIFLLRQLVARGVLRLCRSCCSAGIGWSLDIAGIAAVSTGARMSRMNSIIER